MLKLKSNQVYFVCLHCISAKCTFFRPDAIHARYQLSCTVVFGFGELALHGGCSHVGNFWCLFEGLKQH